jgi:hypothetical protein
MCTDTSPCGTESSLHVAQIISHAAQIVLNVTRTNVHLYAAQIRLLSNHMILHFYFYLIFIFIFSYIFLKFQAAFAAHGKSIGSGEAQVTIYRRRAQRYEDTVSPGSNLPQSTPRSSTNMHFRNEISPAEGGGGG